MWGHPEVYILVIPAFGMFSEIVSTFAQKRIFAYSSMVAAAILITTLSYLVWLHHFFVMGAGPNVNSFFGIVTMLIAIPSGVQVFSWIMTMYQGKINMASPLYWFIGFLIIFMVGGMSGIFMASPPADFQVHNSLFLVAHFHTMIVGVALFGIFAGTTFWFPKIFGFKLDERLDRRAFWFWFVGFFVAFTPLYLLGIMGAPRRIDHYAAATGWQPLYAVALIGFMLIACGVVTQIQMVIVSIRERKSTRLAATNDPWNGRTLEWAAHSPPPFYNFALLPKISSHDVFWDLKQAGWQPSKEYTDIECFKNTGMGIYISIFAFLAGFAIVWQIIWLVVVGIAGVIACIIALSFDDELEYILPAAEVAKMESLYAKEEYGRS
jgi:cytochrome o ubiquinol oxidase subunit 1